VEANRDAVLWFATRIWPLVRAHHPGVRFHVVGPSVTPMLRDLARRDPSIVVTGEVDDLRPYLHRAQVFVCPVRIGSGLRVKVLEAMAAGVPVVTTSLGAEGIPIQPGDTCLIADQPPMMASYISLLLQDELLRVSMARQARQLVADRFAWDRCTDLLEAVLRDTLRRG
jgi:glycosyltransferase involved in cell wall biosynthesis